MTLPEAWLNDKVAGEQARAITAIVSHHEGLRGRAEHEGIEYIHLPVTKENKPEQEGRLRVIIEQMVEPVDRAHDPRRLTQVGRDMEAQALARAVNYHVSHRVLQNGLRTVVFRGSRGRPPLEYSSYTLLDVGLTAKASRESLQPWHVGEFISPSCAPVSRDMSSLGSTNCTARSVSRVFFGLLEHLGVAAVTTFHARQFIGGGEVTAMTAAGEMSRDLVMSNHRSISW